MPDKDRLIFEFGNFRLDPESSSLWRGGELVTAAPKAIETLVQLVSARGEVVSRETLLEKVWPDTFVEEGNINYTISLLRKTLGDKDAIQTIPRRGYRFTLTVSETGTKNGSSPPPESPGRRWILVAALAASVVVLVSLAMWIGRSTTKAAPERTITSLAVLPLKDLNAADSRDPFAVGLADLLISQLGSLDRFTVRPIDTVSSFTGDEDPALFASRLNADAVFTGTLRRENGRVLVNARMLDVRDGRQIWAAQFDAAEADVFTLQEELARQIAASISNDLGEKEQRLLAKRSTQSTEAYNAYIRGRSVFDQKTANKSEKALIEFQRAIAIDPTYSLAYAGMADALSRQGNEVPGREAMQFYSKAKAYAQRAMELDPDSAEAFVASARIKRMAEWDWPGAEQDFKKAIALNPNNADAHLYYGQMLGYLGRFDEGLAEIEKAIAINPISTPAIGARLAIMESKGEIDEAFRLATEYQTFARENPNALRAVGTFSLHRGDNARVIEIGEQALEKGRGPQWAWYSLLAAAYHRLGNHTRADAILARLEELARHDTKALYSLAMNYAELGRADESLAALEKCFAEHEERMVWLKVEPRFSAIRGEDRFRNLVKRMDLEP